ncbi:MAG: nuclear transport factor 2 family protein [Myxococcota bacterium]
MTSDALVSQREDELAIRDLANRYARMIDRRDWPELPRVFTPDCELSGQGYLMRGHAELGAGLRKIDMFSATQHCVLNQVTCLDGDRATGEFYCIANHIHERDGVQYKLDMGIRYDDHYLRTPDGWRLAKRVLNLIWQQDLPLDLSLAALAKPARPARARPAKSKSSGTPKKRAAARPAKSTSRAKNAKARKKPARKRSAR